MYYQKLSDVRIPWQSTASSNESFVYLVSKRIYAASNFSDRPCSLCISNQLLQIC